MSTISTLRLGPNNDVIWNSSAILADLQAVTQIIYTTIFLFMGEWWENLNFGTPMFQNILGQAASAKGIQVMSAALSARIASVPFVSSIVNVSISFNPVNRAFSFEAQVLTAFSVQPVIVSGNFTPGQNAGSVN